VRPDRRRTLAAIISDYGAVIRTVNRNIRIARFEPLAAAVDRTLAPERLVSGLTLGFGILATFLTSVGLYGVLAYDVARRTSELGIRMALGASRPTILQLIMKDALWLVGGGLAVGLVAAVSLGQLIAKLLVGVPPHDVLTFAAAAATLTVVAAVASYVPARRATAVEPLIALRDG
jgi:macrolide transport system ATP-binding/permease protein